MSEPVKDENPPPAPVDAPVGAPEGEQGAPPAAPAPSGGVVLPSQQPVPMAMSPPAGAAPPQMMPAGGLAPPVMPPMQQASRLPPPAGSAPPPIVPPAVPGQMPAGVPPPMAPEQPLLPPQQGPIPGAVPPPAPGPIQPPGQAQPYRQLKVEDALAYLDQVKMKFEKQPHIYNKFLDIMKEFKAQSIDTPGVIDRVLQLFHGHRELILGFNTFLPPGYKIEFSDDESKPRVQLKYPQGMTGPQPQGFAAMNMQAAPPAAQAQHHPPPAPPHQGPMGGMGGGGNMYGGPGGGGEPMPGHGPGPMPAQSAPQPKKAPIEFDQAINYVTKIKTRFAKQPETYKQFLEILHTYQKEQKTIKEVYEQVSNLFKNHADLLGEFSQFLPDGSPEGQGLLGGPKGGKGKGGMGGMGMGGGMGNIKQPVAQRPNNKPGAAPRPGDDEEERYWNQKRKNQGKGREDPKRADVARSPEAEFFSKCRNRMPKPLYLELLKCLNLYSQQIVDRPELLTLVHDLFKRSQIELFANFRRLLGYSGAGGDQERIPSPPPASNAPQAEGGNFRDLDFSLMRRHGTSYRILPDSYIMPATSGRGPLETLVLNDAWVSVATGTEDLNFKTMRKNQYEESIFRAEDERFELDTTIETNMHTIQYLQPISVEIANLSEQEKRRYKLPTPLSAMHQKSIRRLYGPQGNQVIELLQKCPAAAVGALLKRLQQKDEEWRALRAQCSKTWKEVYEKNYTKSLDHRSFYFKQGDKKNFSGKQMVQEVKQLTETPEEGEGGASGAAGSSNANAAASSNNGQSASDGASTSSAALCLPFTVRHAPLSTLHDDTLELMTFAAKLNFSVFEGEIEDKLVNFWKGFVRTFFVCPDQKVADGAAAPAADDSMDVDDGASADGVRCKPLLIVAPGDGETEATRDARPPEQRWTMPMQYPKTSAQLFLGNSHFYIFTRLYHVIAMRLDAARGMAAAAQASAETAAEANGDDKATAAATAVNSNGIAAAASVADGGASADQMSRASLLAQIRADCKGDLYVAFTSCLKQLIDGKMEASTYEDVMRTLLGTNAYLLFTLHKIIAQALKQLQMILVEETSQRLLDLYHYERQRAAAGSFAEATYRSNARMMLEGDDCFSMEQLYSSGDPNSNGEDGLGGGLWLAFLPEKEDDDDDDVEVEEDDDEDEGDEAGKAETVAYMRSFMQRARSTASLPKGSKGALLLKRRLRSPRKPVWGKAMLSNGLECRSTVGSCKLRFVARSEDVWFIAAACGAKPAGGKKKRGGGGGGGGGGGKRRKLASVLEGKGSKDGPNVLSGLGAAKMAPLPKQHVLKPLPETTAAAASGSS